MFRGSLPDAAGLYRVLRAMQQEGYLQSEWKLEDNGPAKRVYTLTAAGRDCLRRWANTLESYSKALQETVEYVKQRTGKTRRRERSHA